jgi:acyl-[acyl carrier protein]--UDP-N-acetylglucosamine O-acyltransferase
MGDITALDDSFSVGSHLRLFVSNSIGLHACGLSMHDVSLLKVLYKANYMFNSDIEEELQR